MVEEKPQNPAKTPDKKLLIGLGVLFVLLAGAYAISLGPAEQPEVEMDEAEIADVEEAFNAEETEVAATKPAFDLKAAKKERVLGNTSAPIKITEHSSFSCGHCAKFHNETLAAFKSAYIDTGKAYIVFSDFPLNAPALHASMTARCVDEGRYFEFTEELFATQSDWAHGQNYMNLLEQKAANYGLSKADFAACIKNDELQKALLGRMKAVQQQWQISSTPSFIVNNQEVIGGALPFAEFEKAIQDALAKIEAAGAPDETPDEGE